jgi:ubiquinone/menaquinone biosynthesis C-methylase UbiE
MMSSYNHFADVYDILTTNVDYKVRSEYISGFFIEQGISNGTILDLACGTGSMSLEFAKMGYDIIGVDLSQQMLTIAQSKLSQADCNFSLINSKIQDFSLVDGVDGCICCLDSINHLNSINEIFDCFKNVFLSLKKGGIFVFDVNTIYKHKNILANNTFVFDEEDFYLVWENEYDENSSDNEVRILLDLFLYNGKNYDRFSEEFYEKAYDIQLLKKIILDTGFEIIGIYSELSKSNPKEDDERIYFVCKKGK